MKLKEYKTKNYFGLQKEDQVRNKIGYINKNGWLNASCKSVYGKKEGDMFQLGDYKGKIIQIN
jgi:hypothetical protein